MKKRNRIRQILSLMLALALFMSSVPVTDVAYAAELTSEVQSEESTEETSTEAASTEEADSSESTTEEAKSEEATEKTSEEVVVEYDEEEANREDIQSPIVNGTTVTFNLVDPEKEYTSVHVAGDIPGAVWGITAPDFEMNYDADKGCWTLTVESLPVGTYNYKFIVNGDTTDGWHQDPLNDPDGGDTKGGANSTFYIADPNKVSPVVNGNEVTFNYYTEDTTPDVKLAGSMTDWGNGAVTFTDYDSEKGCWTLTITVDNPGVHQYKFIDGKKENEKGELVDNWITDPLNSKMFNNNNAFVIAGLTDSQVDVVVAQATELPKMDFYNTEINPSKVDVTYELADKTAAYASKVTLEGNTITLAEDIEAESFDLTATCEGYTATLTVNVRLTSYPKEDETVKSPVVNGKEVTFNLYGPKYTSVHVVGNIPDAAWGTMEDDNKMTYNEDTAYWSIKMTLPAGSYEYKFITNGDAEKGYIHDPLNKPEDLTKNCTFTVAGLCNTDISISLGDSKELPKLKLYAADGTTTDTAVTYALADDKAEWASKVTLTEKDGVTTLAVAEDFPIDTVTSFELTATAGGETATVKVEVVNEMYNYTIYYYDELHATGTDKAMTTADADIWFFETGKDGKAYEFSETEKLSDGRTWVKKVISVPYTDVTIIPRSKGGWEWQHTQNGVRYNNKDAVKDVTIYLVYGDSKVYTELPEVKENKERYIIVEYTRTDDLATKYSFYTWNNGYGTNFYPFEEKDGKVIAKVPVMPGVESVSYCLVIPMIKEDGSKDGDWSTKDPNMDHICATPVDQTVVKIKMEEGKGITYTYPYNKGYEFDTENNELDFFYRNDDAFLEGATGGLHSVKVEIDGKAYDMTFDENEQRYEYSMQGLAEATYKYRYIIKTTEQSAEEYVIDAYNPKKVVENGNEYSVCKFGKYKIDVTAAVYNASMDYNQNNVLSVDIKAKEGEDISEFELTGITADLTSLGGSAEVAINTELKELTISLREGITAGKKTIPVTVYDQYANKYMAEATVEVKDRVKGNDFDWDEAVVYFTVTDRFFDGNTSNNGNGYDVSDKGSSSYHGGDFAGLTQKLDYLKELGINTIWITPIVANDMADGLKTDVEGIKSWGYHGYWASDFEKLDSHLGTEEEFKKLLDEAHARGMKIMVDVVLNHAGYSNEDYFNNILKDEEGNSIPMIRTEDQMVSGDDKKSSLSGLPDFVTENPEVRSLLIEWQTNWISKYPVDYYRVDTVKHVDSATWEAFRNAITKIKPEFKLIGEQYGASYNSQAGQLNSGKMDSLLDFSFKHYAKDFVRGMLSSVEGTLAARNKALNNTATMGGFLGSHDEDGFIHSLMNPSEDELKSGISRVSEENAIALAKIAATLQITAKGQPVIYYGEEIGLTGANNYPYQTNRYNFDWSKVDAQKADANSMLNHYTKLLNIRKDYSEVFAKGDRKVVASNEASGYEVIRRSYNGKNVLVAMNLKDKAVDVTFDVSADPGSVYTDLYSKKTYTVSERRKVTITIPSVAQGGTAILVTDAKEVIQEVTVKLHYNRLDGDYSNWNVWFWTNSIGGAGYEFKKENGEMVATINVDGRTTTAVNYIVRKGEWEKKDVDADQSIDISDVLSGTVHFYVESGVPGGKRVLGTDAVLGSKLIDASYKRDINKVVVTLSQPITGDYANAFKVMCDTDNVEIGVAKVTEEGSVYTLTLDKDISEIQEALKTYTLVYDGYYYIISLPNVYASEDFEKAYTYTGDDLGATWSTKETTFKVWAPTAESVKVALYKSGTAGTDDKIAEYPMTLGKSGVWSYTLSGNHEGEYYTYLVNVENKVVEACDPYARTTGVNGKRAMIINLDSTNPAGWAQDKGPHTGMNYTDAVIYELHVRDASIHESSGVSAANKGKYLGLTETGTKTSGGVSTALDHIKNLGVTHVHLLPVYDYGSVDETKLDQPQFNWGYDPVNYNVPEGSYSTDPYNGAVRVKEFKQMVKTMHDNNINVVMDVVYNHVYSADDFSFNQIVPKYFSRTNADGSYTGATGCGNDTASERAMVRKYIVDSVLYWAKEYHIDGFRFDLVGILDVDTMNQVIEEVHAYDPDIIFYGEGWNMTSVEGETMATMFNAKEVPELAFFSDTFRDNLAGGTYGGLNGQGFVLGVVGKEAVMGACVTATTDWCPSPTQTVNYASCHDNYTLKDKLNETAKDATEEERIKMNNLAAAMYMMSEGIPFIHAGEEFLRTKVKENGEISHNSYKDSDYVNALRWNNIENAAYADVVNYYKGLIEFRKNHKALRLTTKEDVAANVEYAKVGDNLILFKLNGKASVAGEVSDGIVMIFNSNRTAATVDLSKYGITGDWNVCINAEDAGIKTLATVNGTVEVAPISALVMVQGESNDSGSIYDESQIARPTDITAITNIHSTLNDIKLTEGWSWKYGDTPIAAFAGNSTKNFQVEYNDGKINFTTELPVRIVTISNVNIASAIDAVEVGKVLDVTADLATVGGNLPSNVEVKAEWSVSDTSVATINASNNMSTAVTGVAAGKATATIKVTVKDGDKSAEFTATKDIKVVATELAQIAVKEIKNATNANSNVYKAAYGAELTIVVTSKSNNVTIKSSDAKVVKVGKVTKNDAGEFTAVLDVKKAGYVKLTAVSDDEIKSQTSVDLYVQDATPIVLTKSIELNKKSNKKAAVYVYANEDFSVEDVKISSDAFEVTRVGKSDKFEVAIKDKDNAKTGNYELKVKMSGVEAEQTAPIKIKVIDKMPKVTIKQTKKVNTFFTDAEANGKLSVTSSEKISDIVLTDCGYVYNFATGEISVSNAEGASGNKGKLTVSFEGYEETVSQNITIKTENKKPVLKLSAKSGTVYPKVGIYSTNVAINDITTGKNLSASDITVAFKDGVGTDKYDVAITDGLVTFTLKDTGFTSKVTANISIKKANYPENGAITLSYPISISTKTPAVVLDKKTVTLNKNAEVSAYENEVVSVSVKGVPSDVITAVDVNPANDNAKAIVDSKAVLVECTGNTFAVSLGADVTNLAKGNYKFEVVAKNGELVVSKANLTIKIVDKTPSIKLTKSGNIDVLNRDTTSIVYKTKVSDITGKISGVKLTGKFAHLFKAEVVDGNIKVSVKGRTKSAQNKVNLITKYDYSIGMNITLNSGKGIYVFETGEQKFKLTQSKPKVTAIPRESLFYHTIIKNNVDLEFSAVNKDGSQATIRRVELTNYNNAFVYNKNDGVLSLVGKGEVVKGKTYSLKFNLYFAGSADNEKPVTVTYKVKVN